MYIPHVSSIFKKFSPKTCGAHCVYIYGNIQYITKPVCKNVLQIETRNAWL